MGADSEGKVFVITRTENECARICFCEELKKRRCAAMCIAPEELTKRLRGVASYSILLDAVNPQLMPEAKRILAILRCMRPAPHCVAVLLPERDHENISRLGFAFPNQYHFHQKGPLDKIFDFLAASCHADLTLHVT